MKIDYNCKLVVGKRRRPLLIMYYDEESQITEKDLNFVHREFIEHGWKKFQKKHIDILLHTDGGVPDTAYKIARLIRLYAKDVTFIIPQYAKSAGTLLCLCANKIILGPTAELGPIDVWVEDENGKDIWLVDIVNYQRFVTDTKIAIESGLKKANLKTSTDLEAALLTKMAEELGTLKIGDLYREMDISKRYATELMRDYMFNGKKDYTDTVATIATKLVYDFPAHNFVIDYKIALDLHLPVALMEDELLDLSQQILTNVGKQNHTLIKLYDLP